VADSVPTTPSEYPPAGASTTLVAANFDALLKLLAERLAPPAELLTRESFAALLDVGVSTFDRLRETGDIGPRPMRLGGLKWHRSEALAWIQHRDQAGELHDAKTWPAVWASLNGRPNKK